MSSQVGSGHIAIFPTMKGFKGRISQEMKSAGASSSKDFEASMKGAGAAAGGRLGRDMKGALSSATGDLGAAAMKGLSREVAAASGALSKARLKQQDEAGRVRVAEARLAEQIEKYGAASSQAVAAEERLASARRAQEVAANAVTAATARLKGAQDAVAAATSAAARSAGAGWATFRKNVSDTMAPLTALGRLGRTALTPAVDAVKGWATSLRTSVAGAIRPATSAISDFALKGAYKASSALVSISNSARSAFGPMLAKIAPVTSVLKQSFGGIAGLAKQGFAAVAPAAASGLSSLVSAAASAGARAGQALGNGLKNAASIGVGAAAAAIGVALGAGFSRLTAIDSARAKLTGLGHDGAAVAGIMQNATASVKGTAFGLGEAANVAAGAVAAQIKPGQELETHLKRVANNAAAAGMSMEDMGSIFNKAATQANGVQNDVIGQLADKGIPIYQELAKTLGVTAGEVFKMASEGKIDFATFSAAAEAAAGTVADEMGKTVPGALKNLKASLGRIGANIFGGINAETGEMFGLYARLGPLIASITAALGPFEERAKGIGSALDKTLGPALSWLTELFSQVGAGSGVLVERISALTPILAPLGAAFAALGAGGLASFISGSRILGPLLGGLTGPLSLLGGPLGIAAAALAGFALSGGDAGAIVDSLTGVIDSVVAALPGLVSKVATFVPELVSSILSQVPALLEAAVGIVNALVTGLVAAIPILVTGAVSLIDGLIQAIVTNLPMIIDGALQLVTGLLTGIIAALPLIIQGGIQLLMALITGIIDALPMILDAALQLVTGLLTAIIENLPMIIQAGIDLLLSLVAGLINALPQLITAAITLVLQLVAGLLTMLPQLITAGIQLVVSLIVGLVEAIPQIIAMLPQIVEAIVNGLMEVDWLGLGADIIQGIIDGFFSMVGAVGDAIGSVLDGILDFFPHSPAKKGPLGPAGWRSLRTSGAALMEQFNAGANDEADSFGAALGQAANVTARRAELALASASSVRAANDAGATERLGAGTVVQADVTVQTLERDPQRIGREIIRGTVEALGYL